MGLSKKPIKASAGHVYTLSSNRESVVLAGNYFYSLDGTSVYPLDSNIIYSPAIHLSKFDLDPITKNKFKGVLNFTKPLY